MGENWSYEVKLDGFRAQLHKVDRTARIYGKNGGDLSRRFPTITTAVRAQRALGPDLAIAEAVPHL